MIGSPVPQCPGAPPRRESASPKLTSQMSASDRICPLAARASSGYTCTGRTRRGRRALISRDAPCAGTPSSRRRPAAPTAKGGTHWNIFVARQRRTASAHPAIAAHTRARGTRMRSAASAANQLAAPSRPPAPSHLPRNTKPGAYWHPFACCACKRPAQIGTSATAHLENWHILAHPRLLSPSHRSSPRHTRRALPSPSQRGGAGGEDPCNPWHALRVINV
jgi:hypothetical protein